MDNYNLFFSLVSILASLITSVVGVKKSFRSNSKVQKKEAWIIISCAIAFAGAAIYLQFDSYSSSKSLTSEIDSLHNEINGSLIAPIIELEVIRVDTQRIVILHLKNSGKLPIRNISIISPKHHFDSLENKILRLVTPIRDIPHNGTEDFTYPIVGLGELDIIDINFIIKWGNGFSNEVDFLGNLSKENDLTWKILENNKNVKLKLPSKVINYNELNINRKRQFSAWCSFQQQNLVEKLLQQQTEINKIIVNDFDVETEVDKRLKKLKKRARGKNNLEKFLNEAVSSNKK